MRYARDETNIVEKAWQVHKTDDTLMYLECQVGNMK